ncbi:MAG: hypothetical protein KDC49_22640 [Saprospiraceae bacterium]|nr:hypothetical protein [Saprospiraceae bacterium]
MSKTAHKLFIAAMVFTVVLVMIYLSFTGLSYYNLPIEERFYHPRHAWFKPSGAFGHGLGILGTLMILFGVAIYIARKRYGFLEKQIRLKYLLEFHIFLCTLGPVLILFHTAFKFGGIVSIAFWSMVAVVLSGVAGRFIYVQIPRSIEGKELNRSELQNLSIKLISDLKSEMLEGFDVSRWIVETLQAQPGGIISAWMYNLKHINGLGSALGQQKIDKQKREKILELAKQQLYINSRISRLENMQSLFKYWHVAHLPFALIMLIIVIIHVGVTLAFGYKWVF